MKKIIIVFFTLLCTFALTSCTGSAYEGSRLGNENHLIMEYRIFNTTDSQPLKLEKGDVIDAEIVCDSGRLSVKIQKDDETPIYEKDKIDLSTTFQVPIEESGTYNITRKGEKAKGSVCFKRVKG